MSTDTPNTQRFGSLPRIQTLVPGDIVVPATTMAGGAVEGGATVPPNTDINFTLQMVLEQIPEQYHGKSAYQVAVDNGFEGDEATWLLSLIGPRGLSAYEVALSEGFEGTPSQWLASLVGTKGDDGRTAYEVAVAEGFSGTVAEWLESIIGPTGDSAYQVAVKNGFVGTESEWLASLKGDPGTTEWDGLANKPAVIASGATKDEARASLDLGTAALSNTADFATAAQGLKADGAVQLESPGVVGRVAVFGSADGVSPGVALGTAATASFENMPFVNRLVDSGRFDGGGNQFAVEEADFDAASQFTVENGATAALGGRFFNDNEDFGGAAGPLETTIADLITATGRTGAQGRNGVEFMIASITSGAGTSRGAAFDSGTKYPMVSASDHQMVAGQGGRATWVGWLRAFNGNVGLGGNGCTVYVMGVAAGAQTELAVADGWRHVRIVSDQTANGELRDFPYFYGTSGVRLEVAMSAVFAGVVDPGIHSTPLLGDGNGGEFPWTLEEIGAAPIHNPHFTGVVEGVTKEMVGLGNADNTADADKVVAGVAFKDTRAINDAPSALAASRAAFVVKSIANAGNPPVSAGDGLAYIGNFAGMAPAGSEGKAVQLSFGDGLAIRQATGISVWGPWRKLWHDGNMGAGSGLIADMLDGFHESAFLRSAFASDWSAKPAIMTPVSGSTNGVNGSTTYYGVILPSGSTPNTHNVAIAGRGGEIYFRALEAGVYGNWNKLLHSGNTGPGAGLDADKLGSQLPAYYLNRANHTGTQAWGTITGTPTSLAGYGITDAVSKGGTDTITGFKYFTTRIAGGFGGNARAEGSNWNNSVLGPTTELIHRPSTSTNGPTVADPTKYFHTLVFETGIVKNQSGDLTQLIVPDGENASIAEGLWLRGRYSGTWGSWRRIPIESADGKLSARVLKATAVQGSMPLEVTSTTLVTNLNADMLDGFHANAFALANNSVLTGTTSLQNATVDGLLTASRLSRGNGFVSSTGSATVTTSAPAELVDSTGAPLSPQKTYRVSGYIQGSGSIRGAVVLFAGDGTAFTRSAVFEQGNTSNHVEFFLNAGVPSVRLYDHETLYTVKYLVEEVANFGRAFSDFGIINKASQDGTNASGTWGISITGSAATLTTPRSINGTNFDGSANITTATWGTARNLTIGASTKSVNGSASVDWTLSEIGAEAVAAKGVPNGYAPLGADGKIALTYLPASMPGSDSADRLSTPRTFTIGLTGKTFDGTANVSWSLTEIGAPSVAGVGATGTWGISITGNAATVTNGLYSTGSYADPAWLTSLNYSKLVGTVPTWNQNTTGSAAKLTTARTIALTGAATGTATGFDGAANIAIPVTALNADSLNAGTVPNARMSGLYDGISIKTNGANTVYGTASSGSDSPSAFAIKNLAAFKSSQTALTGAIVFISSGLNRAVDHLFKISGYEYSGLGNVYESIVRYYVDGTDGLVAPKAMHFGSVAPIVRRAITPGGKHCLIIGDVGTVWNRPQFVLDALLGMANAETYVKDWTVAVATDLTGYTSLSADFASNVSAITAASANTLATGRTINGTTFDGSGNITTANWGTSRTLTIGATGKAVNGSGNVSWSLTEIGAVPSTYLQNASVADADATSGVGVAFNYLATGAVNKPTGTDHALMTMAYSSTFSAQIAADWRTNQWYLRAEQNSTWSSWVKIWHSGNMGASSGLDADLLDGQHGTFYQNASNLNAGTVPVARSWALTGDVTSPAGSSTTTIANSVVTLPKMANVGSGTVFYRKSAGSGVPEVQPLATLKSDLGINAIEVTVATARATVAKVGTTASGTYVPAYGDRINVTFSDGISAASPTLNIDGGGAKNIRLGLTNVSTTLLSTGAGTPVTIPLWYDGTYWQMYGSHLNTTYSSVSLGGLQTGTASTGYLASPLVLTQWKDWFLTDYAKTVDVNLMLPKAGGIMTGGIEMGTNSVEYNQTLIYSPSATNDVLNIRRYSKDYTLVNVMAPPQQSWGGAREATLALCRGDGNEYFLDLYNMDYGSTDAGNNMDYGNAKMGMRLQRRGTGTFTPFFIEYSAGAEEARALEIYPRTTTGAINDTLVKVTMDLEVGRKATVPVIDHGNGFITWTGMASVTPATGTALLDSTGAQLSPTKTYKVSACNIDSSAQRGAVALFVGDGSSFTIKTVYEQGTTSSNVQLYLDSGVPTVSVYGGSGPYRIPYIIEEAPNFGQPFSEFALLQRPIDAPSDGKTYGRKNAAWIEIASGGGATNISLGTVTSTAVPLVSSTGTGVSLTGATSSLAGLLVAADKIKLDGIAAGATVGANWNTNIANKPAVLDRFASATDAYGLLRNDGNGNLSWENITLGSTNLGLGTRTTTTLPLTSSTGVGVDLPAATTALAGLMTSSDKSKLDGIQSSATYGAVWGSTLTSVPTSVSNLGALANATGWLKNNGSGTLSWTSPTKSDVGLGNVDNTADSSKSVNYATSAGSASTLATSRTFTIGSTGKSFNGSANVSWTAAEMGVVPVSGNTTISGTLTATDFVIGSDKRLKSEIDYGFVAKGRLRPVKYTLISTGQRKIGFIADDFVQDYPELVDVKEDGTLALSYSMVTAVLASQLNEAEDKIQKLSTKLDDATAMIERLSSRLDALEGGR